MSRDIRIPAEAAAALAKGLRIEAIKLVRQANHGVDLRGAMEAVDAYATGRHRFTLEAPSEPAIPSFDGLPTEALAALARGQLIEAIKIVREKTGLGLKEAKDLVERHRDVPNPERDDALRAKLEGIASKHGFKLPEAALAAMDWGDLKTAMNSLRQTRHAGPGSGAAGASAAGSVRGANTVSRETNRYGWLWGLLALALLTAGYLLLG